MEPNQQLEAPVIAPAMEEKKPNNPARKWLIVSGVGVAICVLSLGVHILRGGNTSPAPMSKKVMSQVFGFTPYYFKKDVPPDHLRLQSDTPKFLGNALTFTLADSRQEIITVSEKAVPSPMPKIYGESMTTSLGSAYIKTGGGHISAVLTTSDKTYITLNASDFISSGTLIDIYNNLTPVMKNTGQ